MRTILLPLFLAMLAMLLPGCGQPVKSIVGEWSHKGRSDGEVATLRFGQDGTFLLVAGNDFAAGAAQGTYHQTADQVIFESSTEAPPACRYRWIGPTTLGLTADYPGAKEDVYERTKDRLATAALPGMVGPAAHSSPPPQVSNEREQWQNTTCLSNMKQLGTAMLLYAQDNDGTLPDASQWAPATYPYTKSDGLYTCPALKEAGKAGGYAMDSRLSEAKAQSLDGRTTVMLFESTLEGIGGSDPQTSLLQKPRHSDGIGLTFLDGHAEKVPPR